MVVEHIDGAARRLRQRRDAELQAVVDPGFFLEREELPNFSWALRTPDFRRRTASSRPSRCGMVTIRGLLIDLYGDCLSPIKPSNYKSLRYGAGHDKPSHLHRTHGLWTEEQRRRADEIKRRVEADKLRYVRLAWATRTATRGRRR